MKYNSRIRSACLFVSGRSFRSRFDNYYLSVPTSPQNLLVSLFKYPSLTPPSRSWSRCPTLVPIFEIYLPPPPLTPRASTCVEGVYIQVPTRLTPPNFRSKYLRKRSIYAGQSRRGPCAAQHSAGSTSWPGCPSNAPPTQQG